MRRFIILVALTGAVALLASVRHADAQWNDACGTAFGVCRVRPAPIGSPCGCGQDQGKIIPPGGFKQPTQTPMSIACGTFRGVCETFLAPVGSGCTCFGDPGTVIPQR